MRPPSSISAPLDARAWTAVAVAAAAGLAGLLPRAEGGADPFAFAAWAMLVAPAAGFLCGALGVRLLPMGLAVPALWMVGLVQADLAGERDVASPLAPGLIWTGAFLLGLGLGAVTSRASGWTGALRGAGLALLLAVAPAWLGVLTGVVGGGGSGGDFAAAHPAAQAWLLELSPLTLLFDAMGWDWMRASPLVYRHGGAEWVVRSPWNAGLAATVAVVVGCTAAVVLSILGDRRDASSRSQV